MSTNPYESGALTNPTTVGWPMWINRACWGGWLVGAALIGLSWMEFVSPTVGWIGFAVATIAAAASYIAPRHAPSHAEDWAVLTSQMLDARNNGYYVAIERFRQGATILYEGLGFALRPGDQIACAAVASMSIEKLNEELALQEGARAQAVFETLRRASPDFATTVAGKVFRVSVISEYGSQGEEICRVVDGVVEWVIARPEHQRLG